MRRGQASVVSCQPLQELTKLHFKPTGSTLTLLFRANHETGDETPPWHLELRSPDAAAACVDHLKSRLAGQGVSATRTTLANSKALERAAKVCNPSVQVNPSVQLIVINYFLFHRTAT